MLIPIIEKNPALGDFTCRDGETELNVSLLLATEEDLTQGGGQTTAPSATGYGVRFRLENAGTYPTANIRVALQAGDGPKCSLMLSGEASRVDAAASERITQAIVAKGAEALADIMADCRARGLWMLPFRVYAVTVRRDGSSGLPSAQAVMLPADFPPHPEITASHIEDDGATLSLQWPVRPQRLVAVAPEGMPEGWRLQTFVSRTLWIPAAKEITGSLGSVRRADGSSGYGIRFSFMTESRIRNSVAAPDKYYRLLGERESGQYVMSAAATPPDYGEYVRQCGMLPAFPAAALRQEGLDADPLDWIADWRREGDGYLPVDAAQPVAGAADIASAAPEGLDASLTRMMQDMQAMTGYRHWLLTRPMTFSEAERSRRHAEPTSPLRIRIYGIAPEAEAIAVLLSSTDGRVYEADMAFDPVGETALLPCRRLFRRLLIGADRPLGGQCIEVT